MSPVAARTRSAAPSLERFETGQREGVLELAFCRDPRGRTALRSRRQRFPLRTTMPFHLDAAAPDMAFVYVQNPTGGVFAGDRLLTSVTADAGARVHLTTQSATKLYRMDGGEARQELRFELASGSYVENIPDALIPQAGTRYRQRTRVELAAGAEFVTAETIAPGRRAHGERFGYDLVELTTEVRRDGVELCVETLRMEPARARPDRAGLLGDSDYLVSMLALAPESDATRLAAAIDSALAGEAGLRGAAGELPRGAGALVRILAPDTPSAERGLRRAWAAARDELLGLPLPERRK
jgi:urease accessory protein